MARTVIDAPTNASTPCVLTLHMRFKAPSGPRLALSNSSRSNSRRARFPKYFHLSWPRHSATDRRRLLFDITERMAKRLLGVIRKRNMRHDWYGLPSTAESKAMIPTTHVSPEAQLSLFCYYHVMDIFNVSEIAHASRHIPTMQDTLNTIESTSKLHGKIGLRILERKSLALPLDLFPTFALGSICVSRKVIALSSPPSLNFRSDSCWSLY